MADQAKGAEEIAGSPNAGHDISPPSAQTQPPTTAAAFAAKALDLHALRDSVVDAAGVGAGLWFSYLFVLLYLAIAVGGVTHRELLLETPVKLPFLNVDLPLIGFFVLGPLLFIIVHTYVLLHIGLLARKARAFDAELRNQITEDDTRTRLRLQLPSNIFVQFLAGPKDARTGITGVLLRAIAWVSLVVGPVALLVFFVLQFLPYHSEPVSWWQRLLVAADLTLLWLLWPQVVQANEGAWTSAQAIKGGKLLAGVATVVPAVLVFTVATFPGEWLDRHLPDLNFIPTKANFIPTKAPIKSPGPRDATARRPPTIIEHRVPPRSDTWSSPHKLLFAGGVDFVAQKPRSLWSNRLVLPGFDVIDRPTLSLRGRHLEGAVLIAAHLRKVDLTGAQLQGAELMAADLREANLDCVGIDNKVCTQLQDASLDRAQLQGASLYRAQLQGASLAEASVWRVDVRDAVIEGARVTDARSSPLSAVSFEELRRLITEQVPEGKHRHDALEGIERLDPTAILEEEDEMAKAWAAFETSSPALTAYEKLLAQQLRETGCAAEGAPYVLRNLIWRHFSVVREQRQEMPSLAAAFLDEEHCAGARGLSEIEKESLKRIRDLAQTPKEKQ
jgi:hypothetical protein